MNNMWCNMSWRVRQPIGSLVVLSLWLLLGGISAWAASKQQFPLIQGDDLLRDNALPAPNEIEFIYLYGSLGLLQDRPGVPKPPDVHLSTDYHKNVMPLFKHDIYHEINVYLQAEFIDYTIWGLLENFVFDEIDEILFESDWNQSLQTVKAAQAQRFLRARAESGDKYSDDIFSQYDSGENYRLAEILSPDMLSEFQSILSADKKNKNESLSARNRLYDLANDKRVKVKYAKKSNKPDTIKESEKYARENPGVSGLEFYRRDGVVVRLLAWVSKTLKYFYVHKIQGVAVGLACVVAYLFLNAIVLRKYAIKG